MTLIDGGLAATLALLRALRDPQARLDAFLGGIIAHGGSLILPSEGSSWGPHLVEFSLHGVHAAGATPDEALDEWMACATRLAEAFRPPLNPATPNTMGILQ